MQRMSASCIKAADTFEWELVPRLSFFSCFTPFRWHSSLRPEVVCCRRCVPLGEISYRDGKNKRACEITFNFLRSILKL